MSGQVDVLCLANSVKHGNRCVAGVRLDTGGWIRPVSTRDGGAVLENHYTTESGRIVQPLDSVRLHFEQYTPKYHQPENWLIAKNKSWELLTTELRRPQLLALNTALQRSGEIFLTAKDHCSKVDLKQSLSTQSLTLIQPQDPDFYTETTSQGSNQPRVEFGFDGNQYDLSITDPAWRDHVTGDMSGSLPSVDDIGKGEAILFTISLGEEFDGLCYKIVAAIFTLDDELLLRI